MTLITPYWEVIKTPNPSYNSLSNCIFKSLKSWIEEQVVIKECFGNYWETETRKIRYKFSFAEHYRGVFDIHYIEPCTEFVHTIRSCVQNAEINNNNNHVIKISELEIHKACTRHSKRGKATWLDGVTSEHILCGGKPVAMALKALFDTVTCPNDWKQSIIVPIYKGKGKRKDDPGSYRPVSLISVLRNCLSEWYITEYRETHSHFPNRQQQGFQNGCVQSPRDNLSPAWTTL